MLIDKPEFDCSHGFQRKRGILYFSCLWTHQFIFQDMAVCSVFTGTCCTCIQALFSQMVPQAESRGLISHFVTLFPRNAVSSCGSSSSTIVVVAVATVSVVVVHRLLHKRSWNSVSFEKLQLGLTSCSSLHPGVTVRNNDFFIYVAFSSQLCNCTAS